MKLVFFDGGCGLCSQAVRWIHRHDTAGEIRFAALESSFATKHRDRLQLPEAGESADTFVFWNEEGGDPSVFVKSEGAIAVLKELGGFWAGMGALLSLIPLGLRTAGYDFIARHRRKWFGSSENCPLPSESLREKILG